MNEETRLLKRRQFLTSSLAALATAGMTATSYGRILGANDRIRVGGIGPGDRGSGRLATAEKLGAQIVALADVNKGMLDLAQKKLTAPVEKTYVDYNELLARKDIDAVIIATPDHLHHDCLLAAVKAGKDAYIEKPLARTIEEGENMVATVKASKQIVQVGNQRRSGDHFKKARDIVAAGGIGEIRFVRIWDSATARLIHTSNAAKTRRCLRPNWWIGNASWAARRNGLTTPNAPRAGAGIGITRAA